MESTGLLGLQLKKAIFHRIGPLKSDKIFGLFPKAEAQLSKEYSHSSFLFLSQDSLDCALS